MRMHKCVTAWFMSVLILMVFLPGTVLAAGKIDLQQDAVLNISYRENDKALAGAQFALYLVAATDEYGALTVTEAFEKYNVKIEGQDEESWKNLASTLEGYVLRDQVTPAGKENTDEKGLVSFSGGQNELEKGLYLVIGQQHTQDGFVYEAAPFMVLLPRLDKDANDWIYEITVYPKHTSKEVPKEETVTRKVLKVWDDEGYENERPEKVTIDLLRDGAVFDTVTLNKDNNWAYTWEDLEAGRTWKAVEKEMDGYTVKTTQEGITFVVTNTCEPGGTETQGSTSSGGSSSGGGGSLPQTGQLWWPVPVLLAAGLFLVVIGLLLHRGAGYEK